MSDSLDATAHRREAIALFRQSSLLPPVQVEAFVDYHNRGMISQLTRHVTRGDIRRTLPDPLMPPPKQGYPTIFIPHSESVKRIRQEISGSMQSLFEEENRAARLAGNPPPHDSVA